MKGKAEGMKIQKYGIALDGDGRNVLAEEFSTDYAGLDNLDSPKKIVGVMEGVFGLRDKAEEYMYLICMTTGCRPIGFFEVSHGTCHAAVAGMREIFVRALLCGASDIVAVHNHPGGCARPSAEDIRVTERIQKAADLLGIVFCDHIIISRGSYFSFSENGKMRMAIRKHTE